MSEHKEWREKLFYEQKNGYDRIDAEEAKLAYAYCEGYKQFLNTAHCSAKSLAQSSLTTCRHWRISTPSRTGMSARRWTGGCAIGRGWAEGSPRSTRSH